VSDRVLREPPPDHPITIDAEPRRVRVRALGQVIVDTQTALALKEGHYPVVHYSPRSDTDMSRLAPSDHTSWCPFKGEARYFHLVGPNGARTENAVWSYEAPPSGLAGIKDHLAFYPDKIDALDLD
jgi:uncharacterized protein (DUF427 family)